MKKKLTVYLDEETRRKLDEVYAWALRMGSKTTYSYIVTESIKVWHECVMDKEKE